MLAAALMMVLEGALATASASSITADGFYRARPGEQNTVVVAVQTGHFTIADTTAPLTAGRGCDQIDTHHASCGTVATCR